MATEGRKLLAIQNNNDRRQIRSPLSSAVVISSNILHHRPRLGSFQLFFMTLVINKQERKKYNARSNPIERTRILGAQDHLTDQREWDCQRQADSYNQGGGQEHCVCPAIITDKRRDSIELPNQLVNRHHFHTVHLSDLRK